jgi:hypothetical protein
MDLTTVVYKGIPFQGFLGWNVRVAVYRGRAVLGFGYIFYNVTMFQELQLAQNFMRM